MQAGIPALDLTIIVVYLIGVLAAGILSTRRQKLTSTAYFLAGRSLGWPMVGAALFASNISTIHFVGLAASGYNEGLVWGNFEWGASFTLIVLGLVFAPFYFRSQIATLPEFLERRYSPASRTFLAFMAILAALFIHIGMSLYAGAAVFEQFFGIDVITSIVIITVITGIYTISGGLKAVVVTETIQSVVLIVGATAITAYALAALPEHGIQSVGELKAALKPDQLSVLHSDNRMGLAWYAVLLGFPINGIWYWCTDQTIVQRVLGARSEWDAQQGAIFAGFLKILPVFIMVLPGVIAYVLFPDIIGDNANQALPVLITELIPTGMKGLISAALLAALMSTIASALNSCGTLFAVDIYSRLRPNTSDRRQVQAGRISAVVIMVLAMIWSTQGGRYTSIFEAINAIAAHLSPPITTVFLWGVFWRRGTQQASLATLIFGFTLGAAAFIVDLPVVGTEKLITEGWGIPFLLQGWWTFVLCSIVYVFVSRVTPPPKPEQIDGLTWENPLAALASRGQRALLEPRTGAAALAVVLGVLYYVFR